MRRTRARQKRHDLLDHRDILGPEPLAPEEPDDEAVESVSDPAVRLEDVPPVNLRTALRKPCAAEVKRHEATHVPHELWCDTCVAGRGRSRPHHPQGQLPESSTVQRVDWDWGFLRDAEGQPSIDVLIGVDFRTSVRVALVADNRMSSNLCTIAGVLSCLRRLGHYGAIELRTDGKPALVDLMRQVGAKRGGPTVVKQSPPADHASNGRVERTVRSVEETSRVLNIDLRQRTGHECSVHNSDFQVARSPHHRTAEFSPTWG